MTAAPLAPFFDRVPEEGDYPVRRIEGEVPSFLAGTYYLNGPARFRRDGAEWRHWLDGDGMVSALTFGPSGARFRNRFVRSDKLVQEEAAGRPLFRAFGTAFAGDALERGIGLESPANVSVFPFAGKLLAFGEQGLPWEIEPDTLATRGECDFERALRPMSPFAAHPNFDLESGEMFNFGISFAPASPKLFLYRFAAGGELLYRRQFALEHPLSIHDFGLTQRLAVFYLAPYVLDIEQVVDGGSTLLDALSWRPELGSELRWMDRESGAAAGAVAIGDRYCLHLVGSFEDQGRLVVDALEMDRPVYDQYLLPALFPEPRVATPARYVVELASGELIERRELPYREMCDFPQIDPRLAPGPYDAFWMLGIRGSARTGAKFFDQLVRGDWARGEIEAWDAPPGRFLAGEPVYAPDPERARAGAILCQELAPDGPASAILVFDSGALADGPVARLLLEQPVPPAFHGVWTPGPSSTGRAGEDRRP